MRKYTTKEFIEKAKQKHGDYFDYSETVYVNRRTKVYIICPIHGGFWQLPERHLKSPYGCPKCSYEAKGEEMRMGLQDFVKRATDIHGDKYSYENVDYVDGKTKVEIICKEHGVFLQTKNSHLQGQGCPHCPKTCISLGEKRVSEWLDMKNIKYIPQYKIKNEDVNCENKHIIIDFYIPKENLFIEYNGEQHYGAPFYFGGEERFERQVRRDNALRKYCEIHGVKLIEIPYTEFNNIENILAKELKFQ